MMRRRFPGAAQKNKHELRPLLQHAQRDEYEPLHQIQADFCEASSSKMRHSADPKEECRLVLLGGNKLLKAEACNTILRIGARQHVVDLEEWNVKENCVLGRRVTVAVSPSFWLEHLKSYFFFSRGVKSIKNDIKKCVSEVFPGPHAFLLVVRDGREAEKAHYLLKAVASVFGHEAFDYSMALFIGGAGELQSEPTSMKCVKMCARRHHFLQDTDSSVQKLFSKVEDMVARKRSKFFIPSAYAEFMEDEFESWERKRILDITEPKTKLDASQLRECELQQVLDTSRSKERTLKTEMETSQLNEGQLRMELNASHQRERKLAKQASDYELKDNKLRKQLDDFKSSEHKLRKDCYALQIRESELRTELDASQLSESKLAKTLHDLEKKLDASKRRERDLERNLDAVKLSESDLKKELEAVRLRENKLIKKLDDFKSSPPRVLDPCQRTLREAGKEHHGAVTDQIEQEAQPTGTGRRRGSKDFESPNLSVDHRQYKDTL